MVKIQVKRDGNINEVLEEELLVGDLIKLNYGIISSIFVFASVKSSSIVVLASCIARS